MTANQGKKRNLPKIACGTCRHFHALNEDGGECRHRPPIALLKLDGQLVSTFPGVRKADIWCGEYKTAAKG